MTQRDTLFADANDRADILRVADGLKLYRAGRTFRGECPINGCSAGKKADGAFWVHPDRQRFGCFVCRCQDEIGGDAVALEHALHGKAGETLRHAAARLAGVDLAQWDAERRAGDDDYSLAQGVTGAGLGRSAAAAQIDAAEVEARRREREAKRTQREARDADRDAWIAHLAAALWREARPAQGSPVELYLRARGIVGRPLELALQQLRYHPAAYHSGREEKAVRMPAMIGLIVAPLGLMAQPTGGIHVTYLAEGGDLVWRKASVDRAKTVWGPPLLSPARMLAGDDRPDRYGGVWLTPPTGDGPLMVGEGIESVLSAAVLAEEPVRAVAALNLHALQGGWLADAYGRVDADLPKADPEQPAFTWPEPEGAPWGEVRICVDRDMSTITRKTRKAGGGTWKRPLDAEVRARVCGSLAQQNWMRSLQGRVGSGDPEGSTTAAQENATAVRIWAPAPGRDFNDELRARTPASDASLGRAA